ncbi:unnamed protein product, partial [Anisakis simplex]|uniref:ANK_REP_REGION domain-containing protein n=1 Tax=Anisakis simplex TaxID=6269 RepID=A0A0M3KCX0_ANISI
MAEQQRRLIDANQREIEQRELRPERVENAAARLAALRNEVLREEREMARLNAIQREARETFARRLAAEKQLHEMQNTYTSQEDQLRTAASRIDSLKSQLDLLYRRRMSAVNAARAQQNRFNSQTNSLNRPIKKDNSSRMSSGSFGEAAAPSRPQASVEPFQITRPTVVVTKPSDEKRTVNTSVVVVPPPPPPVPPTPQSLSSSSSLKTLTNVISPPSKDLTDRVVFRKPLLNEQLVATNRDESPSPPKDPYPSLTCAPAVERPVLFVQKSEPNLSTSVPVASVKNMSALRSSSANVGQQQLSPQQILSTPSAIPSMTSAQSQQQHSRRSTNMHNLWNEAKILDQEALLNANDKTSSKCDDNGRVTMSDQISIRADTLRAAKRRSWAQQETLMDEAEYIRKILCEQQKKGRTHLNLDPHLKNLLNNSPVQEVVNDKVQPTDPVEASVEEAPEVIATTSKLLDETTEAVSVIESD